jgi:hypothetical protein
MFEKSSVTYPKVLKGRHYMQHSQTTTVETLTAKVHVLQVNNRQVTLSVAKQLDWVEPRQVWPMGRIKIPWPKSHRDASIAGVPHIVIIGSHWKTGDLVVSHVPVSHTDCSTLERGYKGECDCLYDEEVVDQAVKLPLIVLAGLK